MAGAQEAAGILYFDPETNDLEISDVARKVFIERCLKELEKLGLKQGSTESDAIPSTNDTIIRDTSFYDSNDTIIRDTSIFDDLGNVEKYPEFHEFWVDGILKTQAKTLNVDSNFAIPVFDPTALAKALDVETPPMDLATAVSTFAAPIPNAIAVLNVEPERVPELAQKAVSLVKPPLPPQPAVPQERDHNHEPYGQRHINEAHRNLIIAAYGEVVTKVATPDFWANGYTFDSHSKIAESVMTEAVASPITNAPVQTPPTTGEAYAKAAASVISDMTTFASTTQTIGAGIVVQKQAETKGYLPKALRENPSLAGEAAKNYLYPFIAEKTKDGAIFVFGESRDTFFGDAYLVDFLYALGKHMKSKTFDAGPYIVEVGNMSEKSEKQAPIRGPIFNFVDKNGVPLGKDSPQPENRLSYWRWSDGSVGRKRKYWSSSHSGAAVDLAYPLKDPKTGKRLSGMKTLDPRFSAKQLEQWSEGLPTGDPSTTQLDALNKYTNETSPFKQGPFNPAFYDFEALYEFLKFCIEFGIQAMREGRIYGYHGYGSSRNRIIGPNDVTRINQGGKEFIIKPFRSYTCMAACMDEKIIEYFINWASKNKKISEKFDGYTGADIVGLCVEEPFHADHIHLRLVRSHYDEEKMSSQPPGEFKKYYRMYRNLEEKYDGTGERAVNYELLQDPQTGEVELITT